MQNIKYAINKENNPNAQKKTVVPLYKDQFELFFIYEQ